MPAIGPRFQTLRSTTVLLARSLILFLLPFAQRTSPIHPSHRRCFFSPPSSFHQSFSLSIDLCLTPGHVTTRLLAGVSRESNGIYNVADYSYTVPCALPLRTAPFRLFPLPFSFPSLFAPLVSSARSYSRCSP